MPQMCSTYTEIIAHKLYLQTYIHVYIAQHTLHTVLGDPHLGHPVHVLWSCGMFMTQCAYASLVVKGLKYSIVYLFQECMYMYMYNNIIQGMEGV